MRPTSLGSTDSGSRMANRAAATVIWNKKDKDHVPVVSCEKRASAIIISQAYITEIA